MNTTFLGAPVNPTASPDTKTISELEKRRIHKLTKVISKADIIRGQIEWILSFNAVNQLNIQKPGNTIKIEPN